MSWVTNKSVSLDLSWKEFEIVKFSQCDLDIDCFGCVMELVELREGFQVWLIMCRIFQFLIYGCLRTV